MTENKEREIRLVAIDLDDTLLTPELTITPAVQAAVQAAIRRGVVVTLATGRMYRSALPFACRLGLDQPLIVYQGALLKHAKTGEVLWHRPLPGELAGEVVEFLRAANLHVNIYQDDHLYMTQFGSAGRDYVRLARVPVSLVRDYQPLLAAGQVTKVVGIGDPAVLADLVGDARKRWGEDLFVTRSKPQYLEFMHRNAGKGPALAFLAGRLGIKRAETLAIGDSYNDLDLLAYAGLGVAMGNAPAEVKAAAHWVAPTNREDGVAVTLRQWVI
ncbi:MAG: Cof-type HAD-IIB family hydrolase [Heliobacteriaceae bacterium]|nr:Cof-type HAD-IIB family hydrolase [Heliobacteriaceae bacterium]MDD4587767.1 Cof-type HAD-IIB family hydrolase [Heliobacteriaceae bacterium]